MGKLSKDSIAFEALKIMAALLVICFITRIWPIVFLVILGILIAALRLLFVAVKENAEKTTKSAKSVKPTHVKPEPPRQYTEQDILLIAFGILQQRISRAVSIRYPATRWIWDTPNPIERFNKNLPLTIILNRAGGYKKAIVQVYNMKFCGLYFDSAEPSRDDLVPDEESGADATRDDTDDDDETAASTDYSVLAFEWVDANFIQLSTQCNAAISAGRKSTIIPAGALPIRASWESICDELKHAGFANAVVVDSGIRLTM